VGWPGSTPVRGVAWTLKELWNYWLMLVRESAGPCKYRASVWGTCVVGVSELVFIGALLGPEATRAWGHLIPGVVVSGCGV
jgi:hypothetical protein